MDEQPAEAGQATTKSRRGRTAAAGGKTAGPRSGTGRGRKAQAAGARRAPLRQAAQEGVFSKASGVAYDAADTMFHVATDGAQTLSRQVTGLLDSQVAGGAEMISQVAGSARLAADDLDDKVPQVAGVVRTVADQIDSYAEAIREQSVDQMLGRASDFTRRQPAVAFGLAALAGSVLLRAFRSAPGRAARDVSDGV